MIEIPSGADLGDSLRSDASDTPTPFILSYWALFISFIFASGATAISLYNIGKHLANYNNPALQRYIVRILCIVPIYAIGSLCSLAFPSRGLYFDSVRDIWEAVVIYCFLVLILEYCGGENSCLNVISQTPGSIPHAWPLRLCLKEIALNGRFLKLCKQWTLQFVVVKPFMAVCSLLIYARDLYHTKAYQISLIWIYNVSCFGALYALVSFYLATREHPMLVTNSPVKKFISVKIIVFATYWQSLFVSLAPGLEYSEMWNSFILCCEMLVFACMQLAAFNHREFYTVLQAAGFECSSDLKCAEARSVALKNARDAVNMTDVMKDAYYNFHKKYRSHVKLEDSDGGSFGEQNGIGGRKHSSDLVTFAMDSTEEKNFPPASLFSLNSVLAASTDATSAPGSIDADTDGIASVFGKSFPEGSWSNTVTRKGRKVELLFEDGGRPPPPPPDDRGGGMGGGLDPFGDTL